MASIFLQQNLLLMPQCKRRNKAREFICVDTDIIPFSPVQGLNEHGDPVCNARCKSHLFGTDFPRLGNESPGVFYILSLLNATSMTGGFVVDVLGKGGIVGLEGEAFAGCAEVCDSWGGVE